jgi:hypothetical protein
MSSRPIFARYVDPLAHIWLSAAKELGLRVDRHPRGYATTDGQGQLTIAPDGELDPDDCLAQIVLHELCHALVQGEASFAQPDWGLQNDADQANYVGDTVREQACLRVQAALLRPYGLRGLLGPTTDFRSFYDALPPDPLAGEAGDPALPLARAGMTRASRPPFRRPLQSALRATADVHAAAGRPGAPRYDAAAALAESDRAGAPRTPLWQLHPPPPRHGSGLPMHDGLHAAESGKSCAGCVFLAPPLRGKGGFRCHYTGSTDAPGRAVNPSSPACALFRANLDCQDCAACCRHAYDLVPLQRREPAAVRHPQLLESKGRELYIRRAIGKNQCAALDEAPEQPGAYRCTIYHDRPATCRDFTAGTASCVEARCRVGLECGQGL